MGVEEDILSLLEQNPGGLSISDISNNLGNTRATAAKYLELMKLENKVTLREVGRAKLWFLSAGKKTILIVEDEEHIRRLIRVILGESNYIFIEAKDGMEALEIVSDKMPDLIILDLMMPKIDGIKVCSQLKKNALTRKIPILMLTAKKEMGDKIIGVNVGADDYLVKPFEPQELRVRIKTFLDVANAERNSITNLPTFFQLKKQIQKMDKNVRLFYIYFKNLKSYKEVYGLSKTNELIRLVAQLITHILDKTIEKEFYGHDTGNNFLIGLRDKNVNDILKRINDEFELTKPFFYDFDLKHAEDKLKFTTTKEIDKKRESHVVYLVSSEIKELDNLEEMFTKLSEEQ